MVKSSSSTGSFPRKYPILQVSIPLRLLWSSHVLVSTAPHSWILRDSKQLKNIYLVYYFFFFPDSEPRGTLISTTNTVKSKLNSITKTFVLSWLRTGLLSLFITCLFWLHWDQSRSQLPDETRQDLGKFGVKKHEHGSKFWVFFLDHRNHVRK